MTEPPMPQPSNLTRRRSADRPDCWHIYFGDVQTGIIAMRSGNPHDTDPWEWSCGFSRNSSARISVNGQSTCASAFSS
jgi:hypothetical protein